MRMMQRMDFTGRLGKHADGIAEPLAATTRPNGKNGLGFVAHATEHEAVRVDPELDPRAWAAVVVANTRANSGETTIAGLRHAFADETGDEMALRMCRNAQDVAFADEARAWALKRREQRIGDRRADREEQQSVRFKEWEQRREEPGQQQRGEQPSRAETLARKRKRELDRNNQTNQQK